MALATRELQPWSPFRELSRFRHDMEDLVDRFFGREFWPDFLPTVPSPAVESYVEGDKIVVRADLPGIDPKDVEVSLTGNMLTIKGSREQRREEKGRDYIHREVAYGKFERTLTLPEGVKADQIKAAYHNGVLEVTMPAPKELAARKVPIEIEAHK